MGNTLHEVQGDNGAKIAIKVEVYQQFNADK